MFRSIDRSREREELKLNGKKTKNAAKQFCRLSAYTCFQKIDVERSARESERVIRRERERERKSDTYTLRLWERERLICGGMKERDSVCVCEREKETKRDLVQFEKDICITGWREN